MKETHNLDDRISKLSIVGHFVAEFLGVAKNDSSDEEYSDIDHPDGRESNVIEDPSDAFRALGLMK